MNKRYFNIQEDGFYGTYWKNKIDCKCGIIMMIGDDPNDYMARCCVKWMLRQGVDVITMSPGKKDYGHHNYPLERIQKAMNYLKDTKHDRIGIIGASTTGMLALLASSYYPDLTLTIALTPSDFVWQGFMRGNKDGCKEWPVEGESTVSFNNQPIDYMPFIYQHPTYYNTMKQKSKETKNLAYSRHLFDDSENAGLLKEEHMIKVENIQGELVLVGANDDTLWDTVKYIKRMEKRLELKEHDCNIHSFIYEYGTHFVFPQSVLKYMFFFAADLFVKLCFISAKVHPKECKETRLDIEKNLEKIIHEWKEE